MKCDKCKVKLVRTEPNQDTHWQCPLCGRKKTVKKSNPGKHAYGALIAQVIDGCKEVKAKRHMAVIQAMI